MDAMRKLKPVLVFPAGPGSYIELATVIPSSPFLDVCPVEASPATHPARRCPCGGSWRLLQHRVCRPNHNLDFLANELASVVYPLDVYVVCLGRLYSILTCRQGKDSDPSVPQGTGGSGQHLDVGRTSKDLQDRGCGWALQRVRSNDGQHLLPT